MQFHQTTGSRSYEMQIVDLVSTTHCHFQLEHVAVGCEVFSLEHAVCEVFKIISLHTKLGAAKLVMPLTLENLENVLT